MESEKVINNEFLFTYESETDELLSTTGGA
jgi:hypothetical protein